MISDLPRSQEGDRPLVVQVWGPNALFTRPEFKSEPVTYPVMTPTAAVGLLSAIFWKPEMSWRPVAIEVLEEIQEFVIRRNETEDLPGLWDALRAGRRVDTAARRQQRTSVCLRDVAYRIYAHIDIRPGVDRHPAGYRDQFRRRVKQGACFQQPYLGAREFSAFFGPADRRRSFYADVEEQQDLGVMLHSITHSDPPVYGWFHAKLTRGIIPIPAKGIEGYPVGITGASQLTEQTP